MSRFFKIAEIPKDFPVNQSTADRSYNKKQFIPKEIAQVVWEQYAKDGHGSQSVERIGERGGFGWYEIVFYLYSKITEFESEIKQMKTHNFRVEQRRRSTEF